MFTVGSVIAANQKWYKDDDHNIFLKIDEVDNKTATFAGTYGIIQNNGTTEFPYIGEFNAQGVTIGWVVSYWNERENNHTLSAWAGILRLIAGPALRKIINTTRSTVEEDIHSDTKLDYATFVLE